MPVSWEVLCCLSVLRAAGERPARKRTQREAEEPWIPGSARQHETMAAWQAGTAQRVWMAVRQAEMAVRQVGMAQRVWMAARQAGARQVGMAQRAWMAVRQPGTAHQVGMARRAWMAVRRAATAAQWGETRRGTRPASRLWL